MPERPRNLTVIALAWLILQVGGLFSPGLLDDVDSVYIEIAREMLHRHDFVTPTIDGIRFFDKPPLMYWLAAGSMRLFGEHDWAARIPIALAFLALLLAIYALALHLYRASSNSDRPAFYAALIFATGIGPYLYTRFFIPDILICLWLTLGIQAFLLAVRRLSIANESVISTPQSSKQTQSKDRRPSPAPTSTLIPCLAFAATLALNLLTKGFIGLVFPLAFVLLYLAFTRKTKLLPRLHLIPSTLVFLLFALPWHLLAALRNPAVPMPPGLALPTRAGWAWFYLYNEHVARFLSRRIPHDYGQTPIWLFWLYALIWIMPWGAFLPAILPHLRPQKQGHPQRAKRLAAPPSPPTEPLLIPILWALIVLVFFTLSARQEYYSLPALPALALLLGCLLAQADPGTRSVTSTAAPQPPTSSNRGVISTVAQRSGETPVFALSSPATLPLACHRYLLLPLAALASVTCLYFAITAPTPQSGSDLASLLVQNSELYNLSLGHIFDLTGAAMGFFRGPLLLVALGMVVLGPTAYIVRRRAVLRGADAYAANVTLAAGMTLVLLAAHAGLVRFNPILGSKSLAEAIVADEQRHPAPSTILLDGELTSGSTLLFYTRQPVHLVNGRVNGPWFGSFYPDAPSIFEDEASLRRLWAGPARIYLLTYTPASRTHDLQDFAPVHTLVSAGGKTILTNR